MTVLVTGAAGFIGRPLVERLLSEGCAVKALVRSEEGTGGLESPGVEIVYGDMRNRADVERAMMGCERVFHLAVARNDRDAIRSGAENIADTAARAGIARIVFTSGTGVYRRIPDGLVDEDSPIRPDPGYHTFQAEAERIFLDHWTKGGAPVVIARITSLGPGDPRWLGVYQSMASGRFRMVGKGENRSQPLDVSDVVESLLRCGKVPSIDGRTYVIAGSQPHSLNEIVQAIEKEIGVRISKSAIPIRALRAYRVLNDLVVAGTGKNLLLSDRAVFFLYDRRYDVSRARGELGFSAKIGLEEIVRRAAERFRAQGHLPEVPWPARSS